MKGLNYMYIRVLLKSLHSCTCRLTEEKDLDLFLPLSFGEVDRYVEDIFFSWVT